MDQFYSSHHNVTQVKASSPSCLFFCLTISGPVGSVPHPHALRGKSFTTGHISQVPAIPASAAPGQNPSSQFQAAQLYKHPMMGPEGMCHPTGVPQQEHLSSLLGSQFSHCLTAGRDSALLHPAPSPFPTPGISGLFAAAPVPGTGNPHPQCPPLPSRAAGLAMLLSHRVLKLGRDLQDHQVQPSS